MDSWDHDECRGVRILIPCSITKQERHKFVLSPLKNRTPAELPVKIRDEKLPSVIFQNILQINRSAGDETHGESAAHFFS